MGMAFQNKQRISQYIERFFILVFAKLHYFFSKEIKNLPGVKRKEFDF